MAASDALPVPRKNVAYRSTFPILDADGDLVSGAAGLDSERSIDGATFADVTAEATEIATGSGIYFLDLTAAEMNGDTIAIIIKTSTGGAKTTPVVLYPQELGDIRVNVTQWNGAAVAVPTVAGVPEVDITHQVGTVVPTPATAGIPDVNVREWLDAAVAAATAGTPDVNPTRWANGAIPAQNIAGVPEVDITHQVGTLVPTPFTAGIPDVNVQEILDVGVSLSGGDLDVNVAALAVGVHPALFRGTTTAAGTTTTLIDTGLTEIDDTWIGSWVLFTNTTNEHRVRLITEFDGVADTITFAPAVQTAIISGTDYELLPNAAVDVQSWLGTEAGLQLVNALVSGRVDVDLGNAQADTINASALATDAVNEIRNSIISDATAFAGANIDAAISSRATPAQVNAEMLDVLNIDTFVESAGVVAATATIVDMLVWLKTLARNRIQQTSSQQTLRDDAQASDIATAAVSDDGTTAVRDEWV